MDLDEAVHLLKQTEIKRWGILHVSRSQSVAEHSYRVWALSLSLYDYLVPVPHNSNDRESVAYWALTHDADEIWTGDLPSTIKKAMEMVAPGCLKALREKVLSENIPGHANRARGIEGSFVARVVKLAECVEAYSYYSRYGDEGTGRAGVLRYLNDNIKLAVEALGGGWGKDGRDPWDWVNEARQKVWHG